MFRLLLVKVIPLLIIKKSKDIMTEVKVLYFSVESDRNLVEREFNGKKFMSISEIKNLAESLELEYNGCTNIEDFIVGLNDEDYPHNDWVVLVTISKEEI